MKRYLRSGSTSPTPTNTGTIPFSVGGNPGGGNFTAFTPRIMDEGTSGATTGGPMSVSSNGARGMLFVTEAGDPNLSSFPVGRWHAELKVLAVTGGGFQPVFAWIVRLDSSNDILEAHVLTEDDPTAITAAETHSWTGVIASWSGGGTTNRLGLVVGFKNGGGVSTISVELDAGASFVEQGTMIVASHDSFDYISLHENVVYDIGRIGSPLPSFDVNLPNGWQSTGYALVAGLYDGSGQAVEAPVGCQLTLTNNYESLAQVVFLRFMLSDVIDQVICDCGDVDIETDSNGKLLIEFPGGNLVGATTLLVDTVYELEWAFAKHASTGKAEVRLNKAVDGTFTGNTGSGVHTRWLFDNANLTFDDLVVKISNNSVADSATYVSSDFLTDGNKTPRFGTLWVDGDGFHLNFIDGDGSGGAASTHIDETIFDYLTTYIRTLVGGPGGLSPKQSWTYTAPHTDVDVVPYMLTRVAGRSETATQSFGNLFIRSGGSDFDHPNNEDFAYFPLAGGIGFETRIWYSFPDGGVPITKALLTSLESGFFFSNFVGWGDLTQAVVEYLWYEAAPEPTFGQPGLYGLPLVGVGW